MEELNICALFILSNQPTTQPAYQPKSDKYAYLWRFSTNLVEIWYGVSKWKDSTHVCDLFMFEHANRPNQPTTQPAYRPKSKNLHKLDIFQPNWLKLGMESLNGRTQHTHTIYLNQPTTKPPY